MSKLITNSDGVVIIEATEKAQSKGKAKHKAKPVAKTAPTPVQYPGEQLFSVADAAMSLCLSEARVRGLIRQGTLSTVMVPRLVDKGKPKKLERRILGSVLKAYAAARDAKDELAVERKRKKSAKKDGSKGTRIYLVALTEEQASALAAQGYDVRLRFQKKSVASVAGAVDAVESESESEEDLENWEGWEEIDGQQTFLNMSGAVDVSDGPYAVA